MSNDEERTSAGAGPRFTLYHGGCFGCIGTPIVLLSAALIFAGVLRENVERVLVDVVYLAAAFTASNLAVLVVRNFSAIKMTPVQIGFLAIGLAVATAMLFAPAGALRLLGIVLIQVLMQVCMGLITAKIKSE